MISIIVNQEVLEIGEVSLSVNLKSPLFFGDLVFEGSYIFDFSIPSTPKNRNILQYSNLTSLKTPQTSLQASIYFNLTKLFEGEIIVVKSNDLFFDLRFFMFTGFFNSMIKDKMISDVDLGSKEVVMPSITRIFHGRHIINTSLHSPGTQHSYHPVFQRIIHNGYFGYFHEQSNLYTVTIPSSLRFYGAINLEVIHGESYLQIYKNNILQQAIYFDNPVKKFSFSGNYNAGDTFVFVIFTVYELVQGSYTIEYNIKPNSFIICEDFVPGDKTILEPGHNEFCFFPVRNDEAYSDITNTTLKETYSTLLPVINYYQPVTGNIYRFSPYFCSTNEIIGNIFVPFIFARYILSRIAMQYNIQLSFDTNLESEFNTLVLGNNRALNKTELHTREPVEPNMPWPVKQYFFIDDEFNLNDHIPDMKISDFFKILNILGLVIVPSMNNRFLIRSFNEILLSSNYNYISNVTGRPEIEHEFHNGFTLEYKAQNDSISEMIQGIDETKLIGSVNAVEDLPADDNTLLDIYYVTAVKQYWIWNYDNETDALKWMFYSLPYKLIEQTDGDNPVNISFEFFPAIPKDDPKFDINETDTPMGGLWLIPQSSFAVRFKDKFETSGSEAPNWITFYRGMQPAYPDDKLYPMGCSSIYDVAGDQIPGADTDLFMAGNNGLFEKYWKGWLNFIQRSRLVTVYKVIDTQEVLTLDFTKKYLFENRLFFIKELSFVLTHKGYSVAELKLMSI